MINAFTNSLRLIYNTIPHPILEAAFRPRDFQVSLDQRIKDTIILGRVLPDCNINTGKIKRIPLRRSMAEPIRSMDGGGSLADQGGKRLYNIPPEARENRDIVGVIDISFRLDYTTFAYGQDGFGSQGNTLGGLARAALDSHTMSNACLTPTPTLLANNMILIDTYNLFFSDDEWTLVCRLGYDDEFTNISNSSVYPLSELILTATKAYVWVNLVLRIDQAELSGGQEIGQFKAIVDEYKPALDQYKEDLMKTRGAAMYDPAVMRYFIRSLL
jgi:hypothetical protein